MPAYTRESPVWRPIFSYMPSVLRSSASIVRPTAPEMHAWLLGYDGKFGTLIGSVIFESACVGRPAGPLLLGATQR
jgi:hypothetical protein